MDNSIKIVHKKPWWWSITGREWGSVAMTWGNTIYCRQDKLTPRILRHETCHVRQHKGSGWIALYQFIRSNFSEKYYNKMEEEAKQCE